MYELIRSFKQALAKHPLGRMLVESHKVQNALSMYRFRLRLLRAFQPLMFHRMCLLYGHEEIAALPIVRNSHITLQKERSDFLG